MSYTIYSQFSYQELFSPGQINGFLDHVYTLLTNRYSQEDIFKSVFIDGEAAKALQKIPYKELKTIDVSFSNASFFSYIIAVLESMYWLDRQKLSTSYVVTISGVPVVFAQADWPIIMINSIPIRNQNSF